MTPLIVGGGVMVMGIALMIWHWLRWNAVSQATKNPLELRYGYNQFRRRAVVGSLMAITGAIIASLKWVSDYRVFTASILLLLLLLVCILVLAMLDLLNVIVYLRLGPTAHAARDKLIHEYQRRKDSSSSDDPPPQS